MIVVDAEHAALLRGIAKNSNDQTARLVYADWLGERGCQGEIVVRFWQPEQWLLVVDVPDYEDDSELMYWIPWLEGFVPLYRISQPKSRIKRVLGAYAEGKPLVYRNNFNPAESVNRPQRPYR